MKSRSQSVSLVLGLLLAISPAFAEKVTVDQMQSAIEKAKVIPRDSRFSLILNGPEIRVSTYKMDIATEDDCKIDAVLIAKAAFSADPSLARAVVMFYSERNPSSYNEISVTLGEVTAFGSGQLSKQQLLAELVVRKVATANDTAGGAKPIPSSTVTAPTSEEVAGSRTSLGSANPTNSGTPAQSPGVSITASGALPGAVSTGDSSQTKPSPKVEAKPVDQRATYSNYGFSFAYPSNLKVEYPRGSNDVIRLYMESTHSHRPVIDVRVYPKASKSMADLVSTDPRESFEDAWVSSRTVGAGEDEKALISRFMQKRHEEWEQARRYFTNKGAPSMYERWKQHELSEHGKLVPVAVPANVKVGPGKSLACSQRAFWEMAEDSNRNFFRYIAFNTSAYLVQIAVMCRESDSAKASSVFESIIADLKCTSPASKGKATTSAGHTK